MKKRKIRLFVLLLLCVLAINVTAGADRVPLPEPGGVIGGKEGGPGGGGDGPQPLPGPDPGPGGN